MLFLGMERTIDRGTKCEIMFYPWISPEFDVVVVCKIPFISQEAVRPSTDDIFPREGSRAFCRLIMAYICIK